MIYRLMPTLFDEGKVYIAESPLYEITCGDETWFAYSEKEKADAIEDHIMHSEYFEIPEESKKIIEETKASGGRIIAVGTTSCRTLESAFSENGKIEKSFGNTSIFIYPGYKFKAVDALITNFHLPESTLIMLVSALAGRENILNAYKTAIEEKYRFFSFGDAMFIR